MSSIISVNTLCNQPKIKSFDDLTKKDTERKRKERKRENQRKTKEKPREKRKEKREKGRGAFRQQGRRRERVHGIKEKERKSPASHHEPP